MASTAEEEGERRALFIYLGEYKGVFHNINVTLCCSLELTEIAECIDCNTLEEEIEVDDKDFIVVSYSVDGEGTSSISKSQALDALRLLDKEAKDKPRAEDVDMAYRIFAQALVAKSHLHVCVLDEGDLEEKEKQLSLMAIKDWATSVKVPEAVFPDGQVATRLRPELGSSTRSLDPCFSEEHQEEQDLTNQCTVYHLPQVAIPPSKDTGQLLDVNAICNLWTIKELKKEFHGHGDGEGATCIYCMVLKISGFGCPYCGGKKKQEGMGARLGGSLEFGGCASDKTHPASYSGLYGSKVKMFRD